MSFLYVGSLPFCLCHLLLFVVHGLLFLVFRFCIQLCARSPRSVAHLLSDVDGVLLHFSSPSKKSIFLDNKRARDLPNGLNDQTLQFHKIKVNK